MSFVPTLTVLDVLKTKLEALRWTPEGGVAEPAFERVELFDLQELAKAIEELRVFKARACFVVLDIERFENELAGNKLLVRQRRAVALLITDRNYGSRQRALEGTGTSPGVLALKDLVLSGEPGDPAASVLGLLATGVVCEPAFGAFIELRDTARDDLAGRIAYEQDLELIGGSTEFRLGAGPIR
jgi:hypothetical protein